MLVKIVASLAIAGGTLATPTPRGFLDWLCPSQHVVDPFDLQAYQGRWYEIAVTNIPRISFQKGCKCTYAEYSLKDDGNVQVNNTCLRNGEPYSIIGEATAKDPSVGELSVSFGENDIPAFIGDGPNYLILDQAFDAITGAQYTVVGSTCKAIAWILSRSPHMSKEAYNRARTTLKQRGYPLLLLNLKPSQQNDAVCAPVRTDEVIGEIPEEETECKTIAQLAIDTPALSTLLAAVSAADLVETLNGTESYTVFAPTDEAFEDLPPGTVDSLLLAENIEDLKNILLYHVASGAVMSSDLSDGQVIEMANGDNTDVTVSADGIMINDAMVTIADIEACNGVVHVITSVLLPPAVVEDESSVLPEETGEVLEQCKTIAELAIATPELSTLLAAVSAAELVETLNGTEEYTVFAPTDEAFNNLPAGTVDSLLLVENIEDLKNILLYHVTPGAVMSGDLSDGQLIDMANGDSTEVTITSNGIMINDAMVVISDLEACNGVVHVISAVLLPPTATEDESSSVPEETGDIEEPCKTIAQLAIDTPQLSTLLAAVSAAELVGTLNGTDVYTVFAPTDEAFANLPAGTVDTLLLPENIDELKNVLLYHVTSGAVMSEDLTDGQVVDMVNGDTTTVTINLNGIMINDAMVTIADIAACNGVVHVITSVLLPPAPEEDASAVPEASSEASEGLSDIPEQTTDIPEQTTDTPEETTDTSEETADVSEESADVSEESGAAESGVEECKSIAELAVDTPELSTLLAALQAANLTGVLAGEGEFTVFAPTNDAFDKLPAGTLDDLLLPENVDTLTNILQYHVVDGTTTSDQLVDGQTIATLSGDEVTVTIDDTGVKINDADVVVADIEACNGVVHLVSLVLLPSSA